MYVCVCQAVTDHAIRDAVRDGVRHFSDLQAQTGCSTVCGCCEGEARTLLRQALAEQAGVGSGPGGALPLLPPEVLAVTE